MTDIPRNYQRLEGSERRPNKSTTFLGPADANEKVEITIMLRRRPDGPPVPDHTFFATTPPVQRQRLPADEFAALYGASPEEMKKVTDFISSHGLTVVETSVARRSVIASGTVAAMNGTFAVALERCQRDVVHHSGDSPQTETYRGRNGFIHVPKDLAEIIIGIFGLDNRRIMKQNSADPPNTTTITVPQITKLYRFPTQSAAGQTIAILSRDGYQKSDINAYYATIAGSTAPTITDVAVGASNNGSVNPETTQDICIAASAAPGASIAVYFTTDTQKGWVDLVQRVAFPNPGDPVCSVLSSSYYVSNGDDAATLVDDGVTTSWLTASSQAFHDAALQNVTVCVASGDSGSDSNVRDGKAHVQYPASDPWVLSVGGTTVGNINGTSYDEYVWNDTSVFGDRATGGGISDFFDLPSYQNNTAIPTSVNDEHKGRGVPDVAANASANSGYTVFENGHPIVANGTSASAPLWAGLIAVINAAMGENVGFINPALYKLGSSVFRDIFGPPGPAGNALDDAPGYPSGPGWDACTGWGSINGVALLQGLRQYFSQDCVFITNRNIFGKDEIDGMLHLSTPAVVPIAFYVHVDGFRPSDLGISTADLSGIPRVYPTISPLNPVTGMTVGDVNGKPSALLAQDSTLSPKAQRFTWVYSMTFTDTTGFVPGGQVIYLTAKIADVQGNAQIQLTTQGNPFEVDGSIPWLSTDTRVFQVKAGESLFNAPAIGTTPIDASNFIKSVINNLNTGNVLAGQSFDGLPPDENGSELALNPLDKTKAAVFNFALARVRYRALLTDALNVRVFFRLCPALSVSVDYDLTTTYKRSSVLNPDGQPIPVLGVQGSNIVTIPFFAEPRLDTSKFKMETQIDPANVQPIFHDASGVEKVAYFGCWLDINQPKQECYPLDPVGTGPYSGDLKSILELVRNQHQCLLTEIAFDSIPIVGHPSPANSDKLAQRNIHTVPCASPGTETSRRIPSTFEIKPTPQKFAGSRHVDELLINWGKVPAGSIAQIYIPTVTTFEVLALADKIYGKHQLTSLDDHTLQFPVNAITFVPIPPGNTVNHTCLLTIDLPPLLNRGQLFKVSVHQITNASARSVTGSAQWRSIRGSFQISIPLRTKDVMLEAEEQLLSILHRIQQSIPVTDRWYLVYQRYVSQVAQRVQGLGGNISQILPSPIGEGRPTPASTLA